MGEESGRFPLSDFPHAVCTVYNMRVACLSSRRIFASLFLSAFLFWYLLPVKKHQARPISSARLQQESPLLQTCAQFQWNWWCMVHPTALVTELRCPTGEHFGRGLVGISSRHCQQRAYDG